MRSSTSIACLLIAANQPRTLPHVFTLPALRAHFAKTPPSAGAIALIDREPGTFLDTEKENNVISAAIYVMGVKYDGMAEGKRPEGRDGLRKVSGLVFFSGKGRESCCSGLWFGQMTGCGDRANRTCQWIFTNRNEVIAKLAGKIEPPFSELLSEHN